ncbi:muts domain V-domain-containing protein [Mycena floridula]|nr:muts domain V-domain-containing protein [Mycena floridula]
MTTNGTFSTFRYAARLVNSSFLPSRRFFSAETPIPKVKKTRKKVSDLPTKHILPDGSVALPLADHWSGSPIDSPPVKKRSRVEKATEESESAPKRVRKKKVHETAKRKVLVETGADDGQPRNILAREILENLNKFPHCLLLTRVGQFYESYFDQAIEIARLLNIKLTTRKWDGRRIAMCGFPIMHIDKYLKILVQTNNRFVAMCEEFPKYSQGAKEFDRRVVRVITPGTLIDESFLNQYENNYLLAISPTEPTLGLAWIDVSTGEFYSKHTTFESLRDDVARISPREIVLSNSLRSNSSHPVLEVLAEEQHVLAYVEMAEHSEIPVPVPVPEEISLELDDGSVISHLPPDDIGVPPEEINALYTTEETAAIDLMTMYLKANLMEHMPPLLLPNRESAGDRMQIDSHTIKALEIRENIREGGTSGSLLSVVRKTATSGGTRLLSRWLCSPSTSISEINARQSVVAFFHSRPHFRADIVEVLAKAEDASRAVQKFLLSRGDSGDLSTISTSIAMWSSLKLLVEHERRMELEERGELNTSEWASLDTLMSRMVELQELAKRIEMALWSADLDPLDPPPEAVDGIEDMSPKPSLSLPNKWTINPQFSQKLTDLHSHLKHLLDKKKGLEQHLQSTYDAPSLTLRSSPGLGMHVHLAKSKRHQSKLNKDSKFVSLQESNTTKSYFFQDWSLLGSQIFETSMSLLAAEKEAFVTLRGEVNAHASLLRRNARILDELDVALAFASLASEMNFVRPMLLDDTSCDIVNGRHPTVELGLLTSGRIFTPNSIKMTEKMRLHVITGPNMAGKSTLLRQTALMVILAQAGSFVPADHAIIGIVDKLFSRVGAKDDLFHDRSTFMVEMLESAEILRRATPKSLVIMDEVGRGTTVQDGIAIAFATVNHLASVNQCRALFATHFHELADMLGFSGDEPCKEPFDAVSFFCTDVDETEDGHFSYSYRMRPGVNRNSHGLKVAQLAGMPKAAIEVAKQALVWLEKEKEKSGTSRADLNVLGRTLADNYRNKH